MVKRHFFRSHLRLRADAKYRPVDARTPYPLPRPVAHRRGKTYRREELRLCPQCLNLLSADRFGSDGSDKCLRCRGVPLNILRAAAHSRSLFVYRRSIYKKLCERYGEKCRICKYRLPKGVRCKLDIDHDHATGIVRGLLCRPCNLKLGALEKHITWIKRAIAYLSLERDNQPYFPEQPLKRRPSIR